MRRAATCAVAMVVMSLFASRPVAADELIIEVTVSPNVINVASQSTVVTVHTNIAYSEVAGASVTLNNLPISWWKSDDRGYFVAKFNAADVKGIVEPGTTVTLELAGETKLGVPFSGVDEVKVVEIKGSK